MYLRLSARPLFRRQIVGLLCGKGVEPTRGRGRPSGARESQVFLGTSKYIITKRFSKIHLDITTTATSTINTEEHNLRGSKDTNYYKNMKTFYFSSTDKWLPGT